jgi:hypothetical protein
MIMFNRWPGAGGHTDLFVIPTAHGQPSNVTHSPQRDEQDADWTGVSN